MDGTVYYLNYQCITSQSTPSTSSSDYLLSQIQIQHGHGSEFPIVLVSSVEQILDNYRQYGGTKIAIMFSTVSDVTKVFIDGARDEMVVNAHKEALSPRFVELVATVDRLRQRVPTSFLALYDPLFSELPVWRYQLFEAGLNQVAYTISDLVTPIQANVRIHQASPVSSSIGIFATIRETKYRCPICGMADLTEDQLWLHMPAYHINRRNELQAMDCPICRKSQRKPLIVHIFHQHGRAARNATHAELTAHRKVTQLYHFSLVVCRHPITGKYLLCQEFSGQGFWLPGGAVDAGETFTTAALRECMEEAGVEIELKGLLSIEMHPYPPSDRDDTNVVRQRIIFYAEPTAQFISSGKLPKSLPDFESCGACWVSARDLAAGLKLRGREPLEWSRYLESGGAINSLAILAERPC